LAQKDIECRDRTAPFSFCPQTLKSYSLRAATLLSLSRILLRKDHAMIDLPGWIMQHQNLTEGWQQPLSHTSSPLI
jgi:hypothetical protein